MHPLAQTFADQTPEWLRPYVPVESYLDQAIAHLIKKGWPNLTDAERQDYDDITQERVDLMIPEALHHLRRLRDSRVPNNRSKDSFQKGWPAMVAFLKATKTRLTTWWRHEPD